MRILCALFACLFLFVSSDLMAQKRTCLSEQRTLELIESDPEYAAYHKKVKQQEKDGVFDKQLNRAPCAAGNKVILPIAIHYENVGNVVASEITCLENLALDQVQILNDDYQGTNVEIASTWLTQDQPLYPAGTAHAESCVEFCLPTQGHPTTLGDYTGSYAITINRFTGDNAPGWNGYINVYVRNIGALGYSPFPGNGTASSGVTIDNNAFGSFSCTGTNVLVQAPYNKGRTLTHELGHNLNLDHIWGNGCNIDDGVADTPRQQTSYGGCPGTPSTCGSLDMHMNYMDYTNDACMYMFTTGQNTRMENLVQNNMQNVINKGLVVCASPPPTGCPPSYTASNGNALSGNASQTGGTYNNGDYETDGDIESTQNIPVGTTIDYDSKTLVCLNSGFSTAANTATTNFYAFIDGCNNGAGGGALTGEKDEDGLQSFFEDQNENNEDKKSDSSNK